MTSPQQNTVFVTQAPIIVGKDPVRMTCPSCHATITSKVDTVANTKTHLFALLCCGFCCCCVPYCMDSCKSKKHSCPSCGAFLGEYSN